MNRAMNMAAEPTVRRSKRIAARRAALAGPSSLTTTQGRVTMAETSCLRRSRRIAQRVALAGKSPKWRDWARLPSSAVENVADRLRDDDVANFLRFRLVCKLWMEGSGGTHKPRELGARVIDHRFHPRRWILLTEPPPAARPTRRRLLNVATRKIIRVDLPELAGHAVVPGPLAAPEGMLVVRQETTLVVRLLNPLTRHVVDLPTLQTLQQQQPRSRSRRTIFPDAFREAHQVTAAGFADASTVVVYLGHINQMAVARPGDALWVLVGGLHPERPLISTATFHGRFYCVDRAELRVVDLEHRPRPQLVLAADMGRQFRTVSLLDDGGRLMAVCSWEEAVRLHDRRRALETQMELFYVDLEEATLVPIQDIGERAIFTGPRGAVLLPKTRYYFWVDRGAVYFRLRRYQSHFGEFNVSTRHTGFIASSLWGRLTDHVACYATTPIGNE